MGKPGGWHLIGTCPLTFFDTARKRPSLLSPGDRVTFDAVDKTRHDELAAALSAGDLTPESFRCS